MRTLPPLVVALALSAAAAAAPLVVGHRGSGVDHPENPWPENTLEAMRAGFEAGADLVEIDVQLDRDGVAILWHDADVPLPDGSRPRVEALPHAAFPELLGPTGVRARVPTFEAALALALRQGKSAKPLDVELKVDGPGEGPPLVREVARVLEAHAATGRVIVKSFDGESVLALEERLPGIESGYLARTPHETWDFVKRANAGGVRRIEWAFPGRKFDPRELTHRGLVDEARAAGVRVGVWTVNARWQAWWLLHCGVDMLITDLPARMRALVDRR